MSKPPTRNFQRPLLPPVEGRPALFGFSQVASAIQFAPKVYVQEHNSMSITDYISAAQDVSSNLYRTDDTIFCEKLYKKASTIATAGANELMSIFTTIEQRIAN